MLIVSENKAWQKLVKINFQSSPMIYLYLVNQNYRPQHLYSVHLNKKNERIEIEQQRKSSEEKKGENPKSQTKLDRIYLLFK